jgi:hypothetical protein
MGIRKDREIVDALCDIEEGLTEWEVDFVEGIAKQVHDDHKCLTLDQWKKALEVLEDKG